MATEQITEVQSPTSVVADDDIEVHAAADDYSEMEVESSAQSNAEVSLKDDSEIRDVGSTSRTDDAQSEAPSAVTAGRTSKPYDPRPAVDRKKICPFLLRTRVQMSRHSNLDSFDQPYTRMQSGTELMLHTWHDATIAELCSKIRSAYPPANHVGVVLAMRLLYRDNNTGRLLSKAIGIVSSNDSGRGFITKKRLDSFRFEIGMMLDVAILTGASHGTSSCRTR